MGKKVKPGDVQFRVEGCHEPKWMMGTQDLVQGVVTLEGMLTILVVRDVKPQHGGAETEAPGMEDAMNKGMSQVVIDGHCAVEVNGSTYTGRR